jgi:hypothetical protein
VQCLVTVTRLNVPIGAPIELPGYITGINHAIITLAKDRKTGRAFNDNLCLFRCLALHEGAGKRNFERTTNSLYDRYLQETMQPGPQNFSGVDLGELDIVENLFEVAIHVYSIDKESRDSQRDRLFQDWQDDSVFNEMCQTGEEIIKGQTEMKINLDHVKK